MSNLDLESNGNQTNEEEETENEDEHDCQDHPEANWLAHSLGKYKHL